MLPTGNAMIKGDLPVLEKIFTDNFLWTNNMGITNDKKQNLNKISSGNLHYLSWINEDMTIDILDDIAILKTREILKLLVYKQSVSAVQDVALIFINRNGNWLLAGGREINCSLN